MFFKQKYDRGKRRTITQNEDFAAKYSLKEGRNFLFFSVFDGNDVIQNSVNGKTCKRFDTGFDGDVFAVGNDSMGT